MNKFYNNKNEISTNFFKFFKNIDSSLSIPQLNNFVYILSSLLISNSINLDKLALNFNSNSKLDSTIKRISRFLFNNKLNLNNTFNLLIKHIFNNFKVKHKDNRVYISFDHMFVKNKFTVFMLSLRIGKQGFPLYFGVFPGKKDKDFGNAFKIKYIKKSLKYVHDLFKSIDNDINIVFLADRWFGNLFPLFKYIDKTLKDSFVFRCKSNFKIYYFDKKEGHKIWTTIHDIPIYQYHSAFYKDLEFTKNKYIYNLTISKKDNHSEPWFIISNVEPNKAVKYYSYRFGSIETIFKHQKTNGFNLEKTGLKNLHSFTNLYSLVCIAVAYSICLGTDISKNSKCYKNIGFRQTKKNKNGKLVRIVSLFICGLRLFKLALNSKDKYYRLPFTFKLYDM